MNTDLHCLPLFPEFAGISMEYKDALQTPLLSSPDGISEFTFSNLYLFRRRYNYKLCRLADGNFVISGERDGKKFFMTPFAAPQKEDLNALYKIHDYWKNIGESIVSTNGALFESLNLELNEDRDNFDYLYLRGDLALLSGKKYHKKRNLVNAFLLSYPEHSSAKIDDTNIKDAHYILDVWSGGKKEGDFIASTESLDLYKEFGLSGEIVYVNSRPAAYCLGEKVMGGRSFALHFEKGIDDYKGVYQFINQDFALSLGKIDTDNKIEFINREQDLGDEGLRQAKMTYRPCGFVKKWTARLKA